MNLKKNRFCQSWWEEGGGKNLLSKDEPDIRPFYVRYQPYNKFSIRSDIRPNGDICSHVGPDIRYPAGYQIQYPDFACGKFDIRSILLSSERRELGGVIRDGHYNSSNFYTFFPIKKSEQTSCTPRILPDIILPLIPYFFQLKKKLEKTARVIRI